MLEIAVNNLVRQFDREPVLDAVGFHVHSGERIGLVGPNGCGKSTLFRCLAGIDEPDAGSIERPSGKTVGLLEQEARFEPGRTLIDEARRGFEHVYAMQRESHDLAERIAAATGIELERLQKRFDDVHHDLERVDGFHVEHRVEEVLHGLGFQDDDFERPLVTFSGGQQNRALLARMLLRAPDVMLLDEPTNHLDIAATEWLEAYLTKSTQTLILVSHDRWFLDRVTTRILELLGGRIDDYPGNFSKYWLLRAERQEVLRRTAEKQAEYIAKTEDFIRRNKYGQKSAQAKDREVKLARARDDQVELIDDFQTVAMKFGDATRTGDHVFVAEGVSKAFDGGEPLFSDLLLRVERGDRLGIVGSNGSGKTTLLRVLVGELKPDSGTVKVGTGVKLGYYDQQLASIDPTLDAIDAIRPPHDPLAKPGEMRDLLARFGVRGDLALQKVAAMSGGEKSKVALARLAAMDVNVLVLDEPTNHLDLWARDALEEALKEYDGTILFVSHDRWFVDRVATRVLVHEQREDRWRYHEGNYSDYVAFRDAVRNEAAAAKSARAQKSNGQAAKTASSDDDTPEQRRRRFKYRKVEDIEAEIAEREETIDRLEAEMADPRIHRDANRIREIKEEYDTTKARIADLYEHWEEAMELN
jgi:ATP-binding cassette, subfamily F, member 3